MIPILSAEQIRTVEGSTMANEPISSTDLMERAGARCAARILQLAKEELFGPIDRIEFLVVCGMGNNGGDGLVIARSLRNAGLSVRATRIKHRSEPSADNQVNFERAIKAGVDVKETVPPDQLQINPNSVIIDALFGIGINRSLEGVVARIVHQINQSRRPVIAIDLPSGLFAEDNVSNDRASIIHATLTLTFEVPKLAMLLPENASFTGHWELIPIGLDQVSMDNEKVDHFLVQGSDAVDLLPPRPINGHKGVFGHALLIAGSAGKAGAAVLAVQAALRSGAGLVTARVPEALVPIIQTSSPEAMCDPDHNEQLKVVPTLVQFSSIGVGPGIGTSDDTTQMVKLLIQASSTNLVMDADALNILSANKTWLAFLPKNTILTPHPKEFDRLTEPSTSDVERLEKARTFAIKNGCIVVLKSSITAICDASGKVFLNSTGNPGMAKGGSGDALTGMITGLLAQRMPALQATMLGTHLHGLAGDIAADTIGMDGMTVTDLIRSIPAAWKKLRGNSE